MPSARLILLAVSASVVSEGGRDCGARRLPSVFADVTRARSFVLRIRRP